MYHAREFDRVAPKAQDAGKSEETMPQASKPANAPTLSATRPCSISTPRRRNISTNAAPPTSFAIKDGKYITPASESILPSITNKSLMQLAEDMGITVERRHIPLEELAEIQEAAACGTAAVASPRRRNRRPRHRREICSQQGRPAPAPVVTALYNKLRAIQLGEEEDIHGWNTVID